MHCESEIRQYHQNIATLEWDCMESSIFDRLKGQFLLHCKNVFIYELDSWVQYFPLEERMSVQMDIKQICSPFSVIKSGINICSAH